MQVDRNCSSSMASSTADLARVTGIQKETSQSCQLTSSNKPSGQSLINSVFNLCSYPHSKMVFLFQTLLKLSASSLKQTWKLMTRKLRSFSFQIWSLETIGLKLRSKMLVASVMERNSTFQAKLNRTNSLKFLLTGN